MSWLFKKAIGKLGVAALLLVTNSSWAEYPPFVQVKAYMQCYGGHYIYHYKIINNNSSAKISGFAIGRKAYDLVGYDERPELTIEPLILNEEPVITAPAGWKGHIGGGEDFPGNHTIEWEIPPTRLSPLEIDETRYIRPDQTVSGFNVTVVTKDDAYLNGHFTTDYSYGSSYTGLIEFDATEPSHCE